MWNVPPELAEIEPKWNSKQVILYLSHPFRFHCTNGTSDQECRQLIKAQCTSSWCVRRSWVPEFPWSLIHTPHPHQTVCAPLRSGNCSPAVKEVKLRNSRQKIRLLSILKRGGKGWSCHSWQHVTNIGSLVSKLPSQWWYRMAMCYPSPRILLSTLLLFPAFHNDERLVPEKELGKWKERRKPSDQT